jgi:hypothetical protein
VAEIGFVWRNRAACRVDRAPKRDESRLGPRLAPTDSSRRVQIGFVLRHWPSLARRPPNVPSRPGLALFRTDLHHRCTEVREWLPTRGEEIQQRNTPNTQRGLRPQPKREGGWRSALRPFANGPPYPSRLRHRPPPGDLEGGDDSADSRRQSPPYPGPASRPPSRRGVRLIRWF